MSVFNHDYKKGSSHEVLGLQGERLCWRVLKKIQFLRNTNLFYNELDAQIFFGICFRNPPGQKP